MDCEGRVRTLLGLGGSDPLPLPIAVLLETDPRAAEDEAWRRCVVPARMMAAGGWSIERVEWAGPTVHGQATDVRLARLAGRHSTTLTLYGDVAFTRDEVGRFLSSPQPPTAGGLRTLLRYGPTTIEGTVGFARD